MTEQEELKIRPYARLLTMLGEQLIKNEQIALIEILKNAYDADAENVSISFNNFGDSYETLPESEIVITDDGHGMNDTIIRKHWLNPATPEKKRRRDRNTSRTKLGRIIQGEKGIGRFALFKLGTDIKVITRHIDENVEHVVTYDFAKYGDDFSSGNDNAEDLFLDDLVVYYDSRTPEIFTGAGHGTQIIITNLKGAWSKKKLEQIYENFHTLYALFQDEQDVNFHLTLEKNDSIVYDPKTFGSSLEDLLENKSIFQIKNGRYNEESGTFTYTINGIDQELKLTDSRVRGLYPYKESLESTFKQRGVDSGTFKSSCGSFGFTFYVFDFALKDVPVKYQLSKGERELIKKNKIYLYRDRIRVFPYGEPEDDWLLIDTYRGRVSAGHFLSTDQVVGRIDITHDENPELKDKTNREGLIEEGFATSDFKALIQIFLAYIRKIPYHKYRIDNKSRKEQDIYKEKKVQKTFDEFETKYQGLFDANPEFQKSFDILKKDYEVEKAYLQHRLDVTEELAGVGLSVESASHDILAFMSRSNNIINHLITDFASREGEEEVVNSLSTARGLMTVVEERLQNIQSLFTSARKRKKDIAILDILEKMKSIYKRTLNREGIELEIISRGATVRAKASDAVFLQLFINLFDNAIYWLGTVEGKDKKIKILVDGYTKEVTFADNGPGVYSDDRPYIFEPFFSGKGEEGRGLGLYIARQLLERNDYTIDLIEKEADKELSGANFVIYLGDKEERV